MSDEFKLASTYGWNDHIESALSDSTLPVVLRRGYGGAAGNSARIMAYETVCQYAADRIERLEAENAELRNRLAMISEITDKALQAVSEDSAI